MGDRIQCEGMHQRLDKNEEKGLEVCPQGFEELVGQVAHKVQDLRVKGWGREEALNNWPKL